MTPLIAVASQGEDEGGGSGRLPHISRKALIELREALGWIEQHRSGVLRFEIAAVLRRAHSCIGQVLAIVDEAARAEQRAG